MKALLTLAAVALGLAFAAAASATTNVCGFKCYPGAYSSTDGWIPEDDPIVGGVGGQVPGGDGATCSFLAVLQGCVDEDFTVNPCAYTMCYGDEGTGGIAICDVWVCGVRSVLIHGVVSVPSGPAQSYVPDDSPIPDHPVDIYICPGADDPAYDPNYETCW